jgi:hypothetical protein
MKMADHTSKMFYRWQFSATMLWWIAIRLMTTRHVYEITNGSVFTRPSWLPSQYLHQLQSPSRRRVIFVVSLFAMALAGWGLPFVDPHWLPVRLLAALLVSLYHLVESSVTMRHAEYPLLYNVWAMCLPTDYASAVSWGVAVHFVLSTGLAKIYIGGNEWTAASTMRFYLTTYYSAKMKMSRPFLPSWNRWACQRNWATVFIATSTILLECGIVPLTLFLPASTRWIGSACMILMHIGIFLLMSKKVGIVFITTISNYLIGFRCTALIGTGPWWIALMVAMLPNLIAFGPFGQQIPEDWPLSAVSLFMWSGSQAKILAETLMTGNTRVVLATADKSSPHSIMGLPVLHHGAVAPTTKAQSNDDDMKRSSGQADVAVHDCVLRVIGFTILQEALQKTVPRALSSQMEEPWNIQRFLDALQVFLESKHRVFETQSGLPLRKAYYVQIDDTGNVSKVLLSV